jgi:hypothetical protein
MNDKLLALRENAGRSMPMDDTGIEKTGKTSPTGFRNTLGRAD